MKQDFFFELQKKKEMQRIVAHWIWCKTTIRLDVQVHTYSLST